ncbi:unnamed protein product, partial [Brassica oleracea]
KRGTRESSHLHQHPITVRCAVDRQIRDRLLSNQPSRRMQPSLLQYLL